LYWAVETRTPLQLFTRLILSTQLLVWHMTVNKWIHSFVVWNPACSTDLHGYVLQQSMPNDVCMKLCVILSHLVWLFRKWSYANDECKFLHRLVFIVTAFSFSGIEREEDDVIPLIHYSSCLIVTACIHIILSIEQSYVLTNEMVKDILRSW
jgi:hypothetical protein